MSTSNLKAIGFNAGQFGDILISLVAAKQFKNIYPDSYLTYGIGPQYSSIKEFIQRSEYVDNTHIWESYEDWPNRNDLYYLNSSSFDIVFNAMPKHIDEQWYKCRHITQEICRMHNIPPPEDLSIKIKRKYRFPPKNSPICVNLFGVTNSKKKSFSVRRARELITMLKNHSIKTVQICPKAHPFIGADERITKGFSEALEYLESCSAIITIDSSLCWAASALDIPMIGLYSSNYLPGIISSKPYHPFANKAYYLEGPDVSKISFDLIFEKLLKLLND